MNLYALRYALYALKLSLIVMEAQNNQVVLKIILHRHGQLVCFVLVSVQFYQDYSQNILGDNFCVLEIIIKNVKVHLNRTFLP